MTSVTKTFRQAALAGANNIMFGILVGGMLRSFFGTKRSPINASAKFEADKLDGAQYRLLTTGTSTPSAGNTCKVIESTQFDVIVASLDPTEDNMELIIDSAYIRLEVESTHQFLFTPFLARMENGESITTTSSNVVSPFLAVDTAVTGNYQAKWGEVLEGKSFRDNGALYFKDTAILDFTQEVRKYVQEYYRDMINELSQQVFRVGYHWYSDTAEIAITINSLVIINYHFKETKIKSL